MLNHTFIAKKRENQQGQQSGNAYDTQNNVNEEKKENIDIHSISINPRIRKQRMSSNELNVIQGTTNTVQLQPMKPRKTSDNTPTTAISSLSLSTGRHSTFCNTEMIIVAGLDNKYDLNKPIKFNNSDYRLTIIIDHAEETNSRSKEIDIGRTLINNAKTPAKLMKLVCGDFLWVLQNVHDENDTRLLPFVIERKTWRDLHLSINDGRYKAQKYTMLYAANNVIVSLRKIYLIEDRINNGVPEYSQNACKQAAVDTEAGDGFLVYMTKNKIDTLQTLVHWTFLMRSWIDGDLPSINVVGWGLQPFNFNGLTQMKVFQKKITKEKSKKNHTERERFMGWLMLINGMDDVTAYCITEKYGTMRVLNDAWDECVGDEDSKRADEWKCKCGQEWGSNYAFCPRCGKPKVGKRGRKRKKKLTKEEKEKLLIHKTVKIDCSKYVDEQLENNKIERPDDDIMCCLKALNRNKGVPVSRAISAAIWKQFRSN